MSYICGDFEYLTASLCLQFRKRKHCKPKFSSEHTKLTEFRSQRSVSCISVTTIISKAFLIYRNFLTPCVF